MSWHGNTVWFQLSVCDLSRLQGRMGGLALCFVNCSILVGFGSSLALFFRLSCAVPKSPQRCCCFQMWPDLVSPGGAKLGLRSAA